jgi:hypothetical protein
MPIIVNVTPAPKTDSEREQEANDRREKTDTDRKLADYTGELAFFTMGLFVATVILGIATIGLLVAAFFQARDMKASIAAAKEANALNRDNFISLRRAWVSISDLDFVENLKFMPAGASVGVKFSAKNVGSSPAINMDESVEMIPAMGINVWNEVQKFADRLRERKVLTRAIFPGEKFKPNTHGVTILRAEIERAAINSGGENIVSLLILYGVRYEIIAGAEPCVTVNARSVPSIRVDDPNPLGVATGILAHGDVIAAYAD